MEQNPTIGRIVWYKRTEDNKIFPAIITTVHSETCVNLNVFDETTVGSIKTSVVQGIDAGQWAWPERN